MAAVEWKIIFYLKHAKCISEINGRLTVNNVRENHRPNK